MAFAYTTNILLATAPAATLFFAIKSLLKSVGWSVTASSDGATYSMEGDLITHEGGGAGGLNNARAWFVLRQPGAVGGHTRELCFQRGTTDTQGRLKYAVASAFSGGTPSATTVPTADDQELVFGGGTDGSPTFSGVASAYSIHHLVAQDAAPWGWVGFGYTRDSRVPTGLYGMDAVTVVGDPDPFVLLTGAASYLRYDGSAPTSAASSLSDVSSPKALAWGFHGTAAGAFARVEVPLFAHTSGSPTITAFSNSQYTAVHPVSGADLIEPIVYRRIYGQTSPVGFYKGVSQFLHRRAPGRTTADTVLVDGASGFTRGIVVGDLLLPFHPTDVPVVTF